MIRDGQISTPRNGVLHSITRKVAMELCKEHQLSVLEKDISIEELLSAEELFATTTGGGIIPITQVNDRTFSNNTTGEQTLILSNAYQEWHHDPAMSEAVDYQ